MRIPIALAIALALTRGVAAQDPPAAQQVRQTVQAFYDAFNAHGFARAEEFTTEDRVHLNRVGGWTRGRAAMLQELQAVHSTFLERVTDTPDSMVVRFATPDVAIVTVPSRVSTYGMPDGVRHENERLIRTFVVVQRGGRWLIMKDQNTIRRS